MSRALGPLGAALFALAATFVVGCGGGGDSDPIDPGPGAQELTGAGWALFEPGDRTGAKAKFRDAIGVDARYADAYNGLGWSLAFADSLAASEAAFSSAIANALPGAEAFAGRAFVRAELATADLSDALADASTALARDSLFIFSHDDKIDWRDLRVLRAQLFFVENLLDSAAAEALRLGATLPPTSDPAFADSLLAAIERIGDEAGPPALATESLAARLVR